jgi:hypothetical protein
LNGKRLVKKWSSAQCNRSIYAEATKARILEAAMEEFSSYGIAGARGDRTPEEITSLEELYIPHPFV